MRCQGLPAISTLCYAGSGGGGRGRATETAGTASDEGAQLVRVAVDRAVQFCFSKDIAGATARRYEGAQRRYVDYAAASEKSLLCGATGRGRNTACHGEVPPGRDKTSLDQSGPGQPRTGADPQGTSQAQSRARVWDHGERPDHPGTHEGAPDSVGQASQERNRAVLWAAACM